MKKAISIHIGGLHASRGSAIIEISLGSFVAVCWIRKPEKSVRTGKVAL
jgi:chemotaxis receptor (MCP) glutamine deamidase CheD